MQELASLVYVASRRTLRGKPFFLPETLALWLSLMSKRVGQETAARRNVALLPHVHRKGQKVAKKTRPV